MVVDEPAVYTGFDGVNQFFDGGDAAGSQQQDVPDLDFGQMDWLSMMPEISNLAGLNHIGGGMMGGMGGPGMGMPPIASALQSQQPYQQPRQQPPMQQQPPLAQQTPPPPHHPTHLLHQQQHQQPHMSHSVSIASQHYQVRMQHQQGLPGLRGAHGA